jgi:DNA polymerase-3 subunit delta'
MNIFNWHTADLIELGKERARLPHAILIHGRAGTGEIAFAIGLAQLLLCETIADSGLACGKCAACNWFALGNHPDFRLVQPESLSVENAEESPDAKKEKRSNQIRIEQVRALQDFLAVGTHRGGHRVIVLHPADSMTAATQNALLKSLEEPPSTVFMLVTNRPHRLLPTVRSRCRAVPLPFPDRVAATAWLKDEGIARPELMLALAGGAPLSAARIAQTDPLRRRLIERLLDSRFDVISAAEHCLKVETAEAIVWLQNWTYDLLRSRLAGTLRYHLDEAAGIARIARSAEPAALTGYWRTLARASALAQHPLNAKLVFEDLLFQYRNIIAAS